ncbi:MAG: sugar phosphate nucleotidyltransferase [Eubacteriales bacterium]|nr:sugar phosphate nucleotidyltransferase [Eubacteriales bacterium]
MTLVILAAGLGSRYGGGSKKQLDIIGENGEIILDYSVYDSIRASFDKVVLLIKEEHVKAFREKASSKFEDKIKVEFAFQKDDMFNEGYPMPAERTKPWGTAHALLCCREAVGGDNFAVVNADDFYGKTAFELAFKHLSAAENGDYAMIGYLIKNTVTEEGGVSRGVCSVENGYMTGIVETHEITKNESRIYYPAPEGNKTLDPDTVVSMNFFCFTPDFFDVLEKGFKDFLEENKSDLKKCEYYIALPVQAAVNSGKTMRVYSTPDKWYGVTYQRDKPSVIEGVKYLTSLGLYPKKLW